MQQLYVEPLYKIMLQQFRPVSNDSTDTDVQILDYEIVDSEDEALQIAIDASMQAARQERVQPDSNAVEIKDLLGNLHMSINLDDQQKIIISRRSVLNSAFRAIRRPFLTSIVDCM